MRKSFCAGVALAVLLPILGAGSLQAATMSGSLFLNDPNSTDASIIPAGPPDATFNPGEINYQSQVGGYTVGGFLNHPTFNNQSAAFIAAGGGNANLDNTFLLITGTLSLRSGANSFVVAHDDGVVLTLGGGFGTVVNEPGPTSESFTPFTVTNPGAATSVPFKLQYAECCGPPADLVFDVNGVPVGVPEPATWAMLILGVAMIGFAARRRSEGVALAA